jgi:hypothetical protein
VSGKIMGAIYELALTSAQREVLLALADHADDDGGSVRPSHARIAWKLDRSVSSVQSITYQLIDLGVLKVVRKPGPGHPTEYVIDLANAPRKAPFREKAKATVTLWDVTVSS